MTIQKGDLCLSCVNRLIKNNPSPFCSAMFTYTYKLKTSHPGKQIVIFIIYNVWLMYDAVSTGMSNWRLETENNILSSGEKTEQGGRGILVLMPFILLFKRSAKKLTHFSWQESNFISEGKCVLSVILQRNLRLLCQRQLTLSNKNF